MCVKLRGSKMTPGQISAFMTRKGNVRGVWGFGKGSQYNARMESMSTVWKRLEGNRGVLTVDSFWESGKEFVRKDGGDFMIGVLYNQDMEFAVITAPANDVVKPCHARMPLILDNSSVQDFLDGKEPVILNQDEVELRAAA